MLKIEFARSKCDYSVKFVLTLAKSAIKLLETANALAELDVLATLAEVAAHGGYVQPEIHAGVELEIHAGRHPVVEQYLQGERYIPNDLIFEKGEIVRSSPAQICLANQLICGRQR